MPNILLLNGLDFHKKFFNGVMDTDLNQLKTEIMNYYRYIPNFNLNEFDID